MFFYYFESFLREYEPRFEKEHGLFLPVIQDAVRVLVIFSHTATSLELMPGLVAVIQTFGDRINLHPHIHVLVTKGSTAPDGTFH